MKALYSIILLALALNVSSQNNKMLAPSPPMGWNSWNWFGKTEINEQNMCECIDAIVDQGLLDAGYEYFIIDGGWRDSKLGPNGELLAHPIKFPGGMKALADYAHSKGLKFGLHTVPGTHDCGGDPVGGYNREEIHVRQFVDWGLDFVKVDLCKQTEDPCSTCEKIKNGWSEENIKNTYAKWSKLLNGCGRDILFNISAYRFRNWYPEYCNMARSTQDIKSRISKGAVFNSEARENKGLLTVMTIAEFNNRSAQAAGNGFWNDPDMLVTGEQGLTFDEQKTHFALWCIMSAPLFLGNDPRKMTGEEKSIIMNKMAIAIDQDPTEQGRLIKTEGDIEIWKKNLKNGQMAILTLNKNNETRKFVFKTKELEIPNKSIIEDVYASTIISPKKNEITINLNPHSCVFMLVKNKY
jgi:alpha-galactosidase